jgi:hypothetical protein
MPFAAGFVKLFALWYSDTTNGPRPGDRL